MLKYFREREGLSQRELAAKLNMSASAICMYETGKRQPRFEDEETIADFFNVDINTLRGRRITETPELDARSQHFLDLFQNVPSEIQDAVETLLKSSQPKS
jgi:transcriptional regulator with XRE-family HTH domain